MLRYTLIIAVLLIATGCDSAGESEDDLLASGDVVARIDGVEFKSITATAAVQSNYLTVGSGAARSPGATGLAFTLYPFTGAGTYTLQSGQTASNAVVTVTGNGENHIFSTALKGGGAVEVTEITGERVRGTFSFTAQNEAGEVIHVTDGRFNVRFTQGAGGAQTSLETAAIQALR